VAASAAVASKDDHLSRAAACRVAPALQQALVDAVLMPKRLKTHRPGEKGGAELPAIACSTPAVPAVIHVRTAQLSPGERIPSTAAAAGFSRATVTESFSGVARLRSVNHCNVPCTTPPAGPSPEGPTGRRLSEHRCRPSPRVQPQPQLRVPRRPPAAAGWPPGGP
jgi:hypothetical protein